MFYSYRLLLYESKNRSFGSDPVASFGDCLLRFESKRGQENAGDAPRKKLRSHAVKGRDMKVDSSRALDRIDIPEADPWKRRDKKRGSSE